MHLAPDAIHVPSFLRQTLFAALPEADLLDLASQARIEAHDEVVVLSAGGQVLADLRLVVEGGVSIGTVSASGRALTVSTIGPRSWAAWLPCFVPEPLAMTYSALAGSRYIAWPADVIRRFFAAHPLLYPLMLKEIDARMRLLMEWTSQSPLLPAPQRMARLITLLARDRRQPEERALIEVTQDQLASIAGCSRQSVRKVLQTLQDRGLVRMAYGRCEIPRLGALAAFSAQK